MFKLLLIYNIFRGWEAVGKEVEKVGRAQGKISRRHTQTHTDAHGHKKSSRLKDRRWAIGKVSPPH